MNCCKNFCTFASTTVEYMQVNTVSELTFLCPTFPAELTLQNHLQTKTAENG